MPPRTSHETQYIGVLHVGELSVKKSILGGDPFNGSFGTHNAVYAGGGTAAAPITTSADSKNFLEYRCSTTATGAGSDSRALYLRLYFDGATTGGGEAARIFSTVNEACGTVRGMHVSLNWGASGSVSGLGTALTATLHCPNTGTMTGNLAAIEAQAWMDSGGDDDVVIPATHGLIRASLGGDAGTVGSFVNFLHLALPAAQIVAASSNTTHMVTTGTSDTASNTAIRIRINNTEYWLLASSSISA